jgi:hypothetical protein
MTIECLGATEENPAQAELGRVTLRAIIKFLHP